MKSISVITMTLMLTLVFASTTLAAVVPDRQPVEPIEKQSSYGKQNKQVRHRAKKITRRAYASRTRRLLISQRKAIFRRLIDIKIN